MSMTHCPHCHRPLIEIDYYSERLIGCIKCNRWGRPGEPPKSVGPESFSHLWMQNQRPAYFGRPHAILSLPLRSPPPLRRHPFGGLDQAEIEQAVGNPNPGAYP
jgi:hypothetical protein